MSEKISLEKWSKSLSTWNASQIFFKKLVQYITKYYFKIKKKCPQTSPKLVISNLYWKEAYNSSQTIRKLNFCSCIVYGFMWI